MQTKAAAAVAEFKALKKGGSAPAAPRPSLPRLLPRRLGWPPCCCGAVGSAQGGPCGGQAEGTAAHLGGQQASQRELSGGAGDYGRAEAAVAVFKALKEVGRHQLRLPPLLLRPVRCGPVAAAPVAAAPSAVRADMAATKSMAQLLFPVAPAMQATAAAALAEFEALKKGRSAPAAPATPVAVAAPVAVALVAAAPVAAAPSAVSKADQVEGAAAHMGGQQAGQGGHAGADRLLGSARLHQGHGHRLLPPPPRDQAEANHVGIIACGGCTAQCTITSTSTRLRP